MIRGYKGTVKLPYGYALMPKTGKKHVVPPKKPIVVAKKKYLIWCLVLPLLFLMFNNKRR